jgi:serine/threonine-protein kinase
VLYRTEVSGATAIWWRAADLSAPASPLLSSGLTGYFEAVFTPDGRALAYQVDNNVETRALIGDAKPRVVAATDYIENQARVSPDGRWIAFMTNESGSDQIVVQSMVGPTARVQVSSNGGIEPVWSRDGHSLFYRTNKQFMVATVATEPTFAVTSREVFADDKFLLATAPHANYDVSPDGKSLLVVEPVDDPQIVIVLDWAEEVRARLKGRPGRR